MDYLLTDEQRMLRQTVQKFIQKQCPPEEVREWDRQDKIPHRIFDGLKEMGIMGLSVNQEFGGTGGTALDYIIVIEELARANTALSFYFISCVIYGGEIIKECGSLEQRNRFLPRIANGEIAFAYGVTEANSGSDAAAARTTAVPKGDHFILNGTKMFITGADWADYVVTLTRTNKEAPKHRGLSLFLVDTKSKGYLCRPLDKLGLKGSSACELVYDNVAVPKEDLLGGPEGLHNGWPLLLKTLDLEHIEVAAFALGSAEAAFEDALKYAKVREQFGQPIGKFQAISHMLAEMAVKVETAKLLVYHCAWLKTNQKPCSLEACMAKLHATEIWRDVALMGMQIMGGYGYMMEYNMQRYVRDSLIGPIGGGTSQIQKNMIAKKLGL